MLSQARQLLILEDLAIRSGSANSWLKNTLCSLSVRWDERLYQAASQSILSTLKPEALDFYDFSQPQSQDDLPGELSLGEVMGGSCLQFHLRAKTLPMHVFVAGSSGFGKTEFAKRLAEQSLNAGISSLWIIDPKADEYLSFARKYPDVLVLRWRDLRFSPWKPPPNVPFKEWIQAVVGHMSHCFNFWQGAESAIISELSNGNTSALTTNAQLITRITSRKRSFGSKDAMSISTAVSRLRMMSDLFDDVIATDSSMLERLADAHVILLTSGLMTETDAWLTGFMHLWKYMYRVANPAQRRPSLHINDECQHRLFNAEQERSVQKIGASLMSQFVDQARALGFGLCSMSQEPSSVIKAVQNNSHLRVLFHLSSGHESRLMTESMGLTTEQSTVLQSLEPGEAIVRMALGFTDAIPVKFHRFEDTPTLSDSEFSRNQRDLKERLYAETVASHVSVVLPDCEPARTDSGLSLLDNGGREMSGRRGETECAAKTRSHQTNVGEKARALLQIWMNLPNPFLTQGELFRKAGIESGSTQSSIKRYLLSDGFAIERRIQSHKTFSVILEPTEKAYSLVALDKPRFHSKGGYLHQFVAHHACKWGERKGYTTTLEFQLSNGKSVDVVLRNPSETLFVEIAVSEPIKKELSNITKDLDIGTLPARLIMAVMNSEVRSQLQSLIDADPICSAHRARIEVMLAGRFLSENDT